MEYATVHIRYEVNADRTKVQPVRVVKSWVEGNKKRRFITTRLTLTGFGRPSHGPEEWTSTPPAPPITRASLMAAGLLKEAGHGLPYLPL